jgi:serine/threonine protein kinase
VKDVVEAALKLDLADRSNFVRDASGDDLALRDEALKLLEDLHERRVGTSGAMPSDSALLDEVLAETADVPSPARRQSREFAGTARFDVRRRLGSGGFGTVYEAFDREQQHMVALKVLRQTDPAFLYRFKREFRALVDIRHPNLIQLYELFCEDEVWFFTMEFVPGVNFLRYVERQQTDDREDSSGAHWSTKEFVYPPPRTPCNLERLREALHHLSEGVLALHARGIVHRDIKPANVLVPADGRVRLLDFGLVHEIEMGGAHSLMLAGTPGYMAPERLALRPADTSSDWYSVGVMMFQALTGALPANHERSGPGWPTSVLSRIADVPADLQQLCTELLHPDATKRPTGPEVLGRFDLPAQPRPAVPSGTGRHVLVGREAELTRLTGLVDLTRKGRTVVLNLCGQSGIGKSALLRSFRRRLTRLDPDAVMLIGRCHESESVPFKALDDLVDRLSQYLKSLRPSEAEVLTPRDAPSLIRMFPVLAQVEPIARGRRSDVVDAEELRHRAFGSLHDLLARLAERRTLVLAIDDLQWGDLDSVAFLRTLLAGANPPSLLLVATYRSEDVASSPFLTRWRKDLADSRAVTVVDLELGELSDADSHQLASQLLKSHAGIIEPDAAHSVVRESGGSPFVIEHLVRSIRWDRAGSRIGNIRDAVHDGLSELPDRTRRLLETLAIAGQPLPESLACAAAEWGVRDRPALLTLVSQHFVRVRGTTASRELEIYHDRLRKTIVAAMDVATRQHRHLQIAMVLERDATADPAAVSTHWREAGHPDRASAYAAAAGDRASDALAFERAADWYRLALETRAWPQPQALELQRKLAAALALAGRGQAAADVYLKAAATSGTGDRAELQRLAADQLVRSGYVEEGLAILERLARELGVWVGSKPWQTILSIVWHRARAAMPAFGTARQPATDPADRRLTILEVFWSIFIGLADDPIRAMDFHARHMLLAARVGDPKHVALALAVEATSRTALSARDVAVNRERIAKARAICPAQSPEALGFIATSETLCAQLTGNWSRASQLAEQTERFLSEQCTGVAWERATTSALRMDAAFQKGDWAWLSQYGQQYIRRLDDARARRDVHAVGTAMLEGTLRFLVADQPVEAEQWVRDTLTVLPSDRYTTQHLWALAQHVSIALYMGDGHRAWTLVEAAWPRLTKSQFLWVEHAAIVALQIRSNAAIGAAALNRDAPSHIREALKCARRLARKNARWATAQSLLTRASAAGIRGERQQALDFLQRAESEFRACQMAQFVAVCQYRRGTMTGGDEGQAALAAAGAWAASQHVVNAAGVFNMLAPGIWEPDASKSEG